MEVEVPAWLSVEEARLAPAASPEERMRVAIALARGNVEHGTGGPFGAAVFERESGRLVAAGVNLVVASHCSVAHAEIVALVRAQARLRTHDLAAGGRELVLASSAEPCAMCLGAIGWSGIGLLLTGARDADVRAIGFDEGDKPEGWDRGLRSRGIEVRTDLLRDEARQVLHAYADGGGPIYNPGAPGT